MDREFELKLKDFFDKHKLDYDLTNALWELLEEAWGAAHSEGWNEGYDSGRDDGYEEGYDCGREANAEYY